MRNKQILALILAAAVTVPSQIATAADMPEQSVAAESFNMQADNTESKESAETDDSQLTETEVQQDTENEKIQDTEIQDMETASGASAASEEDREGQKAADISQKDSQQKLATVRVTSKDVYGIVGGKASLTGNYDQGYPAVPADGVVWCGGDKQPLSDGEKYSTTTSTTMTLKNITADQDGKTFYLSVTNAAGTAYSEAVTLHVLDASVASQNVQSGQTATLSVELKGDWGTGVRYQWYKGDEKLKGAVLSSYTIKDAQASDAGEYRCVVQRGYGRADEYNSKTVTADVYVDGLAASVTQSHENDKILPGDKVTFHAEPEGDWETEALYQWYDQHGNLLTDNAIYSGTTTDTLTVTAVTELDGMGYYCVISDGYRTAVTDILTMEVEEKAAIMPDGGSEDSTPGVAAGNIQDGGQQTSAAKIVVRGERAEKEVPRTADTSSAGTWAFLTGMGLLGIAETLRKKFR